MKLKASRNFFVIAALGVLVVMSASVEGRGQGRSRRASDKKCAKFVNCHDASEGRVDGRGPRQGTDVDDRRWRHSHRDRDLDRDGSRHQRHRDSDRDGSRHHRHRDIDRDGTWRHRGEADRDGTRRRHGR